MTVPRVAILSGQIPQTRHAGCIQLYRLFRSYPPDRLQVIGAPVAPGAAVLDCAYRTLPVPLLRLHYSRLSRWSRSLCCFPGWPRPTVGEMERLLEGFEPDLVVTVFQESDYYVPAAAYARHKGIPLVLIVHDMQACFEPVFAWARQAQHRRDQSIYREAAIRACVSPQMSAHLKNLHGVEGHLLYPCPDPEIDPVPIGQIRQLKTPGRLHLGYAGGLGYGYGEAIMDLLPILRQTGSHLTVISEPPQGACLPLREATDVVTLLGYQERPQSACRLLQEQCDLLLLPYKDQPGDEELLYATHFPSKLTDYCRMGMPVWVTGWDGATGVRWMKEQVGGKVRYPCEPLAFLEHMRDSAPARVELALAVREAGERCFKPESCVEQLHRLLRQAVNRSPADA